MTDGVVVRFEGRDYGLRSGERVLDAMLRQGVSLPFSCRSGSCHRCVMRLVAGDVPEAATKTLSATLRERGYFLPCRAEPAQNIEMAWPDPNDLVVEAVVAEKSVLAPDVVRVRLEPMATLDIKAGQHVRVVHPEGAQRPYSVASLPDADYFFDLHVGRVPGGLVSNWIHDTLAVGDTIRILRPEGAFHADGLAPEAPVLMLATGTGAAPVFAIVRDLLRRGHLGPIRVLHGARTANGLYPDGEWRDLAATHPNLQYLGCVSREQADDRHAQGHVTTVAADRWADWTGWYVFAAGRPDMVTDAKALAASRGVPDEAVRTDAFTPDSSTAAPALVEPGARVAPPPNPALWAALDNGRVLHAVLVDFYREIFVDDRLGAFFIGVTQQRLVEKQFSFLKSLITGTREYFGQRPRNAHHWMVISDELFDYRLGIMERWLRHHGVEEPWLSAWHVYEEAYRGDIVKAVPVPRYIDGKPVWRDGLEEAVIDVGTLCDACARVIEPGERVRFHVRLGTTYCSHCAGTATDAPPQS